MGYETKAHVVLKPNQYESHFAQHLMTFDLSNVGSFLKNACTKEIDFDFYPYDGNEPFKEDAYGDPLKYCTLDECIEAIRKVKEQDLLLYRRFRLFENIIFNINPNDYPEYDIYVVHEGH